MKVATWILGLTGPFWLYAQNAVSLPGLTVYSPRVANQVPATSFAMPVSALRFEPMVDLQSRNLAEGQADVTLRGGIFENTGFALGAVSLLDPQTGHYFAEIPIAPAMLRSPEIVTGANLPLSAMNSTAGAVAFGWRPVRTVGVASLAFGENHFSREEIYQGYVSDMRLGGSRLAADVAVAHSQSNGPIAFGEHRFDRANLRLQLAGSAAQTDLFAGYQAKFFGWPNLYTPFNSNETEGLQTVLLAINHRAEFGGGDFLEAGAYQRRNKDDYAFNRFAPVGRVHPFQHTTWVSGGAVGGRKTSGDLAFNFRAEILADEIQSTSLTFGRYHTRSLAKVALVPERSWKASDGSLISVKAGAGYDRTNHDGGSLSPVLEIAREFPASPWRRLYASFTRTTQIPTYTALNSNPAAGLFRGNPKLTREASHNLEFGANGTLAGWTVQAAAFWRRDDALVDWTFRRGVTARTANPVDLDVVGLEAVVRRSWAACDVVVGYTALSKNADYRGAVVDASFYALNYARQRLTVAGTVRLGSGFELRMDNVARVQAGNLLRVTGGDRTVISAIGFAYRPNAWRGSEISLQVENGWNSGYQEIPAVPATPRQISLGVAQTW
ncbi:MAG: TonB-dependent receptor [Opitutus sp.]|nr:TonB-dependent receptor [Opitutus sp.]